MGYIYLVVVYDYPESWSEDKLYEYFKRYGSCVRFGPNDIVLDDDDKDLVVFAYENYRDAMEAAQRNSPPEDGLAYLRKDYVFAKRRFAWKVPDKQ